MNKFLLLLVAGLIITITRFIVTRINSASHKNSIRRFQRSPKLAEEFAESLEIPYGKKEDCDSAFFRSMVEKIYPLKTLGNFQINYQQLISENRLLVMTRLEFE